MRRFFGCFLCVSLVLNSQDLPVKGDLVLLPRDLFSLTSVQGLHTPILWLPFLKFWVYVFLTSTPTGQTTIDFIMPQFLLLLLPFQSSVSLWIPLNIPFPDALEGHLKDVRGQNKPICSIYSVQPEVTSILNCLHLICTRDGELVA